MKAPMDTTLNLALALEGAASPASDEVERLTGIAGMLETLPDPEIDPRFVARLEATLMAEFDARSAPKTDARPALQVVKPAERTAEPREAEERVAPNVVALPRRRFVVRKALVGAIAAAMMMALPVVASASALPGSPFFAIEQWRQNHAISSAQGAERARVELEVARKWIRYAAEMVALKYPVTEIDKVLKRVNDLQQDAAQIIAAFGSRAQIERFITELKADVAWLERIRALATADTKPVVGRAIEATNDLTNRLTDEIVVPGPLARAGRLGAIVDGVTDRSHPANDRPDGGQSKPKDSTDPPTPDKPEPPDWKDHNIENPVGESCEVLFSEQLGDTTATASKAICATGDLRQEGPER